MGGNRVGSFRSGNKSLIIALTHRVQTEAIKSLMQVFLANRQIVTGGGGGGGGEGP